jgi:hypothetical protein
MVACVTAPWRRPRRFFDTDRTCSIMMTLGFVSPVLDPRYGRG